MSAGLKKFLSWITKTSKTVSVNTTNTAELRPVADDLKEGIMAREYNKLNEAEADEETERQNYFESRPMA